MLKLFDVKKNKKQIIGLRIFTLVYVSFIIIPIIYWKQPWEYMLLLFLPWDIIMFCVLLYHETWRISFFSDGICKHIFWFKSKTYRYNMIQSAYVYRGLLVVKFKDGKKLYLRSDYDNLSKAMERIERYCRIRF